MADQPRKPSITKVLNPITLLTSLILLIGLVLMGIVILFFGRNLQPKEGLTPEITMISAPTTTPKAAIPTVMPSPTPTSIYFLPEGVLGVGIYAQVTGTGGAGLRMRSEPGLNGAINFSAMDSEVFLVIDGPVDADDHIWWHLEAPYDKNRNGWSAADFLVPIKDEEN